MNVIKGLASAALFFIIAIILIVAVAMGALMACSSLQIHLFAKADYLLFESDCINAMPAVTTILLIISFCLKAIKRFSNSRGQESEISDETASANTKFPNRFYKSVLNLLNQAAEHYNSIVKRLKIGCITFLIIALYCGLTNYMILYDDSVVRGTPFSPRGTTYSYSDIVSVNVGVKKEYKNSYYPYYEIVFFDGKAVNLMESMVNEREKSSEYVLVDLDRKLKMQDVTKNVNNESFEKFAKGMDKKYVKQIKKLFEN